MLTPEAAHGPGIVASLLSAFKPLLPIPALLVLLPLLWWFFRDTWRELDDEATAWRVRLTAEGRSDYRPFVALAMCAVILTLQEYYGGRGTYDDTVRPWLVREEALHPRLVHLAKFDELYGFAWWAFTRVAGYVAPLVVWPFAFPEDSILDMGFHVRGFFKHAWIYGLFLAMVLPAMLIVSHEPDFGSYYPFYRGCSR